MPSERISKPLEHILNAIDLIREWVSNSGGVDQAVGSELVRSAVERQLLVISEAAIRIHREDKDFGPRHAPEVDWRGVRGFGNVIRHRYDEIDRRAVHEVLRYDLDPIEAACRRLLTL